MAGNDRAAPASRQRLLDAGLDLFHRLSLAELWAGITVSEVARRAGVTRATFYANWPTQEDFIADLVRYNEAPERLMVSPDMAQATADLATRNVDIIDTLRHMLRSDFEWVANDRDFHLEIAMAPKADDPVIADAIRGLYRAHEEIVSASLELLLNRWRREPRPPMTLGDISVVLDGLVEGLSVRRWFDPERSRAELFAETVLALIPVLTRPIGDPRTLDDLHLEIDRYVEHPPAPRSRPPVDPAAILATTRRLLAETTWSELALSDIATAAGTTSDAVIEAFGSKFGLAAVVMSHVVNERRPDDFGPGDAVQRLGAALRWLGQVATEHLELTTATLAVTSGLAPPVNIAMMARPLQRDVIGQLATETGLAAAVDPVAVADVLIHVTLVDAVRNGSGRHSVIQAVFGLMRAATPGSDPATGASPS